MLIQIHINSEAKDKGYNIKTGTDYADFTVLNQIKLCNPCNPCPKTDKTM